MSTVGLNMNSIINVTQEDTKFSPRELKLFVQEIADMIIAGEAINIEKAVHNARYFAEIDRRLENVENEKNLVTFTPEEWEKFSNADNV